MKYLQHIKWFLIIFVISLMQTSCLKDHFEFDKLSGEVDFDPNFAAPVAHVEMNLRDIFQDYDTTELLQEDSTGFLYLFYENSVFSAEASDLITIPDQNYTNSITGTEVGAAGGFATHVIKPHYDILSILAGELLDSMIFKYVDLNIQVTSTFQHTGELVITFPGLKRNGGTPYSVPVDINTSSGTFTYNQTFTDLEGYTLDLTGMGGMDTNSLLMEYDLILYDAGSATIVPSNQVSIDVSFQNVEYYGLFGYVGQPDIDIDPTKLKLEFYDLAFQGHIYFENPMVRIKMKNSFGVPMEAEFTRLVSFSNISDDSVQIELPPEYTPVTINSPSINEFGQYALTNLELNRSNSNLIDVMETTPQYIMFDVDPTMNPNGYEDYNYVTDTSKFEVDMEMELPLYGHAEYFVVQDTIPYDMQKEIFGDSSYEDDSKYVEWGKFRLVVENGFPTEAGVQLLFTDSNYIPVDSIYGDDYIEFAESGRINAVGKVIDPTIKTSEFMYTRERFNKLKDVKYMLLRGYIRTTDNATVPVKFYSHYEFDIKIGIQVQFNVTTL